MSSPKPAPDTEPLHREIADLRRRVIELEYIYDAAPVGLVVFDRELRYVRINERLAAMNGRPASEHIGKRLSEILPAQAAVLEPLYRNVMDTGVGILSHHMKVDLPAGPAEHVVSYFPMRDGQEAITGVCGVIHDVTELRESEARYRFLADSIPQFVFVSSDDGSVSYCNPHAIQFMGLTGQEVATGGWKRAMHPDDRARYWDIRQRAHADLVPFETEIRMIRADGAVRWHLVRSRPFAQGDEWKWLGTALDIHDRRQTEQTRALLAAIVDSATDAVVGLDPQGAITSWNPAAASLFSRDASDAIGQPALFLTPERLGQSLAGIRVEWYETFRHTSGADLTLLTTVSPIRNEGEAAGAVIGAFQTFRDITGQRRLERDFSAADERLRLVQRAVKAGTWEIDIRTRSNLWSPELCELYGVAAGETDWTKFVHPEDTARVSRALELALSAPSELRIQYRALIGGEIRWLTSSGSIINGAPPLRMVGITIDTTEIQTTEEALRETARFESIGRIAGGVAHDFNNLLAGILGGASFIADVLPEEHDARPMLDLVIRSSERAAHLTQQLLAYSGKSSFALRRCELSRMVQDTFPLLRGSIPQNVELVVQTGWNLPHVEADANQLRQTLLNLVTNAAEAIGENEGSIWVRTGVERLDEAAVNGRFRDRGLEPGTYVYIEVKDDGPGIAPEIEKRIFEPFVTTRFTGRGLGLSAVEGIVRGHNGAIEVQNDPGRGAAFRVLFPPSAAPAATGPQSTTILAIDDEEAVRNIVRAKLEHSGYNVILATDGVSGLEAFRKHRDRISLVLLDMGLPKMSGREVCAELERTGIGVPVIVTSGYSEGDSRARMGSNRIAGFLQKPFNVRDLAALVEKLLPPAGS